MNKLIKKVKRINGTIELPGDRSISHRAAMIASLAEGTSEITNFSDSLECMQTIDCLRKLGAEINIDSNNLEVVGKGLDGFVAPKSELFVGNSATALCLLTGLLAGFKFEVTLDGSKFIKNRSYKTVLDPLREMGANIECERDRPPFKINGSHLIGINYTFEQSVPHGKSAVLFSALKAEGETVVTERIPSRDHTERIMHRFGIPVEIYIAENPEEYEELDRRMKRIKQKMMFREKGTEVHTWGITGYGPARLQIPGDITLAAPFITAATILKNSNIQINNMGFNPTRSGFVDLVKRMGANFSFSKKREMTGEPVIDLGVRTASLRGRRLGGAIVHNMIDEIPILTVLATQSEGTTVIREVNELRYKETDRIRALFLNLRKMGAKIGELKDGLVIDGRSNLRGIEIDCHNDQRLVMAFTIAALTAEGETLLKNVEGIENTFPRFWDMIAEITDNSAFA